MSETIVTSKTDGRLSFVNFNRIHVVPAMNINDELLIEALAPEGVRVLRYDPPRMNPP
ncbi:hypothetical protein ACX8Z7_04795 [Glutamicibacter endophyticus]